MIRMSVRQQTASNLSILARKACVGNPASYQSPHCAAVRKQQGSRNLLSSDPPTAHRAMTPQSRHAHRRPRPNTVTHRSLAMSPIVTNRVNLAFVGSRPWRPFRLFSFSDLLTLCTLWHLCVLCVNSSPLSQKQKSQAPPAHLDPTQKLVILKLSDKDS